MLGAAALAQQTNTPPAWHATTSATVQPGAPSAGLVNNWLREQSPAFALWDLGGQFRSRLEHKEFFAVPNKGNVDFQKLGDPANTYLLLRERVHLGYTPEPWLSVYGEMQDATAVGDERNPSPDQDHFELRQAWLSLGNPAEFPLTVKAGRQELIYGDQRLIGVADWLNIGRRYDAVKVRYSSADVWVDAFVSQPVIPDRYEFDESDTYDRLSGVYASSRTLLPIQETQVYFMARNVDEHAPKEQNDKLYPLASPRDIYTFGARVKSLPGALGGWDYEAEAAGQLGRFKLSNTSPSLDQQAYAAHVAGGYTWTEACCSPRLGLEYNYASGDSNPNDGKHETFDNLFPSNHGLYGIMDFFAWQNMHNLRVGASLKPLKALVIKLDVHGFWLADTHDYFYQSNGAARRTGGYGINPNAGSYVGSELDLTASYGITSFASVQGGYGHFFVGDYVSGSLASRGGATDANYLYAQLYFNF